jgi:Protein of unknown function (DUF1552)
MKFNRMNRRMFLSGAGKTLLAMPFLPSLLPREAQAAGAPSTSPLRFIMITNHGSPSERGFFGQYYGTADALGLTKVAGNSLTASVAHRPLTEMTGDLSYILAPLTSYKARTSVLRGIDSMALENGPHPSGWASAASGYGNSRSTHAGQLSIDMLIAQKVAPRGTPMEKLKMTLHPSYSGGVARFGNWGSYNDTETQTFALASNYDGTDASRVHKLRSLTNTAQILATFFAAPSGTAKADLIDRRGLMNAVFGDYQRVRGLKNLGIDDKRKLDTFMSYIADVEAGIDLEAAAGTCAAPLLEPDFPPPTLTKLPTETATEFNARYRAATEKWVAERRPMTSPILWRNHAKLIAAAFSCDLVRVASFALGQVGSHVYHHSSGIVKSTPDSSADALAYFNAQRTVAERMAMIMKTLDGVPDGNGTLLDNTLIYWNQNYGCVYTSGGGHSKRNFPVVLAGGAQGKLRLGHYIDYRLDYGGNRIGVPINNLLVTLMGLYGVGPNDYEFKSNTGYGSYDGLGVTAPANFTSLTAKRTVLPFLSVA